MENSKNCQYWRKLLRISNWRLKYYIFSISCSTVANQVTTIFENLRLGVEIGHIWGQRIELVGSTDPGMLIRYIQLKHGGFTTMKDWFGRSNHIQRYYVFLKKSLGDRSKSSPPFFQSKKSAPIFFLKKVFALWLIPEKSALNHGLLYYIIVHTLHS